MNSTCQNCKKEYQPKRKGGRFCSVSCRASAWEKAQQPGEGGWLYKGDEVYLARKLEALMKGAEQVLREVKGLSDQEAVPVMKAFLDLVQWGKGNSVVEKVIPDARNKVVKKPAEGAS
jgi:hypothetical protein